MYFMREFLNFGRLLIDRVLLFAYLRNCLILLLLDWSCRLSHQVVAVDRVT